MPAKSGTSFKHLSEQLSIESSIATVSALEKLFQELLESEHEELEKSAFFIIMAAIIEMFDQHDETVCIGSLQLLIFAWFQD